MAVHDWMRQPQTPVASARIRDTEAAGAHDRRSRLEMILAAAGLAAWVWCAFEVLNAVVR
jgi:hypothetical protein